MSELVTQTKSSSFICVCKILNFGTTKTFQTLQPFVQSIAMDLAVFRPSSETFTLYLSTKNVGELPLIQTPTVLENFV